MGRVLDYPPVWLAVFAAAAWIFGRLWPMPVAPGAGWALVLAGVALMAWAAWVMLRGGATVDPTRPPTALVTSGPYRLSRNPIYLADALILAGLCLLWQPWAAALLVPGFMAVIGHRFIRREEAWLRARDARGFDAWAARTRRWL